MQAALVTAYVCTGLLGLKGAVVSGNVTLIWPPTGIATAAIFLLGWRAWPALCIAAFVTTFTTGAPVAFALATAVGNPLQAVTARLLLTRSRDVDPSFRRVSDVVRFALLGAAVSPAASATIGAGSLCLTGMAPWAAYPATWGIWWLGDGMGVLLVAPLILTWRTNRAPYCAGALMEAATLLLCLVIVGVGIYGGAIEPSIVRPLSYLGFPLVIWAGVRFGRSGATQAIAMLATAAIWGVAHGSGPFTHSGLITHLANLYAFLGVLAVVGLVLAAALDERSESRAALQAAHDELEERVEERTAALRLAKEDAEAASRTKSQFLASMSHELRTPLNAVIGFSEIIKDARMGPLDPRYRSYGENIHAAGSHLLGVINDILDLSKIVAGEALLNEDLVEIEPLVAACLRMIRERARVAGVELDEGVPPDLPPILADERRLKQILLNLLSNAIKFTPAGGRVLIAAELSEDGLEISIADTGIGMLPEEVPIALQSFRQLDGPLNRRYQGTGLGLPLAKMLTELHGGALQIETQPAIGTTVTVRLPASRFSGSAANVARRRQLFGDDT